MKKHKKIVEPNPPGGFAVMADYMARPNVKPSPLAEPPPEKVLCINHSPTFSGDHKASLLSLDDAAVLLLGSGFMKDLLCDHIKSLLRKDVTFYYRKGEGGMHTADEKVSPTRSYRLATAEELTSIGTQGRIDRDGRVQYRVYETEEVVEEVELTPQEIASKLLEVLSTETPMGSRKLARLAELEWSDTILVILDRLAKAKLVVKAEGKWRKKK